MFLQANHVSNVRKSVEGTEGEKIGSPIHYQRRQQCVTSSETSGASLLRSLSLHFQYLCTYCPGEGGANWGRGPA